MRTAASIARLCEIKDVTEEDAKRIRDIWKTKRAPILTQIDKILNTYGVEFLGVLKRGGGDVYYCNAGDTYATTVLFVGDRLVVGCIGDYAESVRQPNDLY